MSGPRSSFQLWLGSQKPRCCQPPSRFREPFSTASMIQMWVCLRPSRATRKHWLSFWESLTQLLLNFKNLKISYLLNSKTNRSKALDGGAHGSMLVSSCTTSIRTVVTLKLNFIPRIPYRSATKLKNLTISPKIEGAGGSSTWVFDKCLIISSCTQSNPKITLNRCAITSKLWLKLKTVRFHSKVTNFMAPAGKSVFNHSLIFP